MWLTSKAQIAAAEARAEQATAAYRQTVLEAFAEVENALDQDVFQSRQERYLAESATQARRSVELADPGVYQDEARRRELLDAYQEAAAKLEELSGRWELASMELEEVREALEG